jgi:MoxR-like ATPase
VTTDNSTRAGSDLGAHAGFTPQPDVSERPSHVRQDGGRHDGGRHDGGRQDDPAGELSIPEASALAARLERELSRVVLGSPAAVGHAVIAVLAGGHLLVEDVPGVGKTVLAKALAALAGGRLARIQGNPDLLPSDITGVTVYSAATGAWEFRPGPVFADVVLVDELNRTPPRSQAALLETMEEGQVSTDGRSWPLPRPHLVIATQNPLGHAGTYPLVESQLDRFLLATHVGYPDEATEALLAIGHGTASVLRALAPVTTPAELLAAQSAVASVLVSSAVAGYAVAVVRGTRESPRTELGASPRATIALLAAAKAHAVLRQRGYVTPLDVKSMAPACLGHRLVLERVGSLDGQATSNLDAGVAAVLEVLDRVPVPRP